MKKYVGLSLSFCIGDICRGRVSEDQVAYIIPGFREQPLDKLFERYSEIYWTSRKNPDIFKDAWEILNRVEIRWLSEEEIAEGKVQNIAAGNWISEEDFIDVDSRHNDSVKCMMKDN